VFSRARGWAHVATRRRGSVSPGHTVTRDGSRQRLDESKSPGGGGALRASCSPVVMRHNMKLLVHGSERTLSGLSRFILASINPNGNSPPPHTHTPPTRPPHCISQGSIAVAIRARGEILAYRSGSHFVTNITRTEEEKKITPREKSKARRRPFLPRLSTERA